jgi:formate dehydrogenase iron-sulfur subunit
MEQMTLCIDISKCTACRACQVACKSWNQLKAEQTRNSGRHENPPDLSAQTWNRIMFIEKRKADGVIDWVFFNDRCRHCDDPPCMEGAEDIPEAIVRHESGAVIYTEKSRELDFDDLATYCPYDIPRKDPVSGRIVKCNLCIDRITHGLKPACVAACSTGTLNFGPREEMLRFSQARIKALGGEACLYPGEECNTIWILPESPKRYPIAEAPVRRRRQRLAGGRLPAVVGVGAMAMAGLSLFRERGLHDPGRK